MLRFLHGGDFHLDSPFHALSPRQAVIARQEQREILDRFAEVAQAEQVHLCFLTGDLFDSRRVYPETLLALRTMLESLPVPIFIAPGNHDPYTGDSPYARLAWPSHVHIFKSSGVEAVPLPALNCTVYGSAFTASYRSDSPLTGLSPTGSELSFGCFHGEVIASPSRYGPIPPEQIAASELHYLALGHVHTASGLLQKGNTYYAYPGCPQGRGFDETGEKGALFGSTDGQRLTLRFRPLCLRQYRVLETDITGKSPEAALRSLLTLLAQETGEDIVRILLTGERDGAEPISLGHLEEMGAPYFYHLEILDRTRLGRDLWMRQKEESLVGLFLREMSQRLETASPEDVPRLELALRFGLAALEGRESPV